MNITQAAYTKKLEKEVTSLKEEVSYLNEQLEWFRRQMFGQRSEKTIPLPTQAHPLLPGFLELDPEIPKKDDGSEGNPKKGKRKKPDRTGKHKVRVPDNLPIEKVILDVPEEEKTCQETGKPLVKIGEEITRKLAFIPQRFFIKEYVRPKYGMLDGEGVLCADLPESLLSRSLADESLLTEIVLRKFADHSPHYRNEESFSRDGVVIPRQVLSQWTLSAAKALDPLYNLMKKQILESGNVFTDETPVDLLIPGNGKTKEAYLWVLAGGHSADPPYRIYSFHNSREHKHAEKLFKDYQGVFHSDKYGAYEKLALIDGVIWCPCWVHIRRKFLEVTCGDLEFRDWILRQIRYLFLFEKVAWSRSPEERVRIRQEKEIPIIDRLIERIKDRLENGAILPKSKLRQAIGYFCGLIPYLKNYTKSPWARLDNNVSERALRCVTIGRKNWLFFGSERGGHAAAVFLSLIQTCRALNINPRIYLEDVMRRIMSHPANRLEELLPDKWLAARQNPSDNLVAFR